MNSREENRNNIEGLLSTFIENLTKTVGVENKKELEDFLLIFIAAVQQICYYDLDKDKRFELILQNLEQLNNEFSKEKL
mgnify:CR=1 FL=1